MKKINPESSIRQKCPEAAAVWRYDMNGDAVPETVSIYSDKNYFFGCKDNPLHVFKRRADKLINRNGEYIGCKYCGPNAKEAFPGDNDFLTLCEMAKKEWAYDLNPDIDPSRTRALSAKYAFFRCEKGHISHRKISDYYKSPGCQECLKEADKLVNQLPVLKAFFDPKRNTIKIKDIMPSSTEMIWVKCPECGYENFIGVNTWRNDPSCRCCGYDGQYKESVISVENRPFLTFRMANPVASAFWDYNKNDSNKTPDSCRQSSNYDIHFKCNKGHEFHRALYMMFDRNSKEPIGCPICEKRKSKTAIKGVNDFFTVVKNAKDYWDFDANQDTDPYSLLSQAGVDAFFRCPEKGHTFHKRIQDFTNNPFCPECRKEEKSKQIKSAQTDSKRFVSFAEYNPEAAKCIVEEESENIILEKTYWHSNKKVIMRCPNNPRHVFPIHIKDIPLEKPFGCIYCSGKKPFPGETDLFTLLPIAKEMGNDKKPGRDLTAINPRSREKVSFKCTVCGHEFDRRIRDFYLRDHSCPKCKRLRNSVAKCAKLMNQWDFEANAGINPNEYNVSCDTEVGWKCKECGYKWRSKISSRYASQGLCPSHEVRIAICEGTNALVDLVPEILLDFNKLDNPGIDINKLSVSSKDLINWRCHECGYKWTSSVNGRVFLNNGVYSVRQCKSCIGLTRTKPYSEEYEILNKMYSAERNEKPFDNLFSSDNLKKQFWWECQNPNCMEIFPQRLDAMLRAAKTASSAMGCPFCAGKKVTRDKSFGVLHPDLLLDYAPENKWDPFEVTEHSSKPATWRCHKNKEHHAWTGTFTERANGFKNCPECVRIFPGRMLSDFRPDLKELFLAKNKKPFEAYTIKSNEKLELRCPKGHEFSRYIYNINETIGNISCPVCDCAVLVKGQNDFASQCDHVVLIRYDLSRNKRKPDELTIADNDRDTWWVCEKGHPFKRSVKDRIQDDSCPVCDYRVIIPGINSFAALNPELAKEVSPDEPINLDTIKPYKKYSPLWRCQKCGHDYRYEMNSRRLGDNVCPVCTGKRLYADINSLAVTNPELAAELDPNGGFNASELMETYAAEVLWICQTCHQPYRYPVRDRRVGDNVCPVCNGKRLCPDINSLAVTNPELAAELDPDCEYKATELMETYSIKALWICPKCNQSYKYPVRDRAVGDHVCPVCNGVRLCADINSLAVINPELAAELDPEGEYKATDIMETYKIEVSWICPKCKQSYKYPVRDRVVGDNVCPVCNDRKVAPGINSFKIKHPDLMVEWDAIANYLLCNPDTVSDRDNTYVWWKCKHCGRPYRMRIKDRVMAQFRGRIACTHEKGRRFRRNYTILD